MKPPPCAEDNRRPYQTYEVIELEHGDTNCGPVVNWTSVRDLTEITGHWMPHLKKMLDIENLTSHDGYLRCQPQIEDVSSHLLFWRSNTYCFGAANDTELANQGKE
ncbi:hypothetical protein CAPTEDRAFT_211092 [Capitella teleta]|uniref:Uncharacterized protein n=1 Tax=Capitella teleta TaxID=283909 RepID=R7UY79_CAPTE|nr:hypothetical protein CAPTEDRAFT_211092 [Capitella teleta]|eukprot:ELU11259.1 hypothetical protein CAPTEDRAFT_211092 [Capitella teleta]